MAKFHSGDTMENRYALHLKPGAHYDSSDEDENTRARRSQDYAQFLKDKERKCCRDGFVDSQQHQKNYNGSNDSKDKEDTGSSDKKSKSRQLSVVDLLRKKDKDNKDYDKRLKVIEEHVWQYKQEERELKRMEGDVIKNQRTVRRSLRDYENAITRKRMAEEKKQNQDMHQYTTVQRQTQHKKEDLTKQRIEDSLSSDQAHKDTGRKVQLVTSQLARQYQTKMSQLELKRSELARLSQDFETKLRTKEEEQFRLKQELADLAISLNMEAQKGRTQEISHNNDRKKQQNKRLEEDRNTQKDLDHNQGRSEAGAKAAEQNRRKMSADLSLTRAHLQLKQREEQRHRKDADNRLRDNIAVQKQLNEAALHADMDQQNKQIDHKVQEHNQRRQTLATQAHRQKKENGVQHEQQYTQKFQKRFADQQRREHEDHLKHFQKEVTRGEEQEYNLYNAVKESEYKRQKKEQNVRHINQKLQEIRRQNAQEIKVQMIQATKREQELEQKLVREQALLAKVHSEREESYTTLQTHRDQLRADKHLLSEHQQEHERLIRVGARTETMSSYA